MALTERQRSLLSDAFFPGLLLVAVYGFALSLLLGRGTYKPALYGCAFAVAGIVAVRRGRVPLAPPALVWLGLGLILFLQGYAMAGSGLSGSFHTALLWSLLAAVATQLLPDRFGNSPRLTHTALTGALLVVFVEIQIIAYLFKANEFGLFANLHYMALFSVITLPVLYYLATHTPTALRWLYGLALLGDFWLLMKTQSRPGFLALLAGTLVTVPFLPARQRLGTAGTIVLVPGLLYVTGAFGFAARINDLAANFFREERVAIWWETLTMQQAHSSTLEWWLGHGFGRFFLDYQAFSSFHGVEDFSFPHNFFLELLYSHGIVGLTLAVLACLVFYRQLIAAILACREASQKAVGLVLISAMTADLVQAFLTLPLFSRHHLYPLSLILGASFHFFRKNSPHD